MVKSCLHAEISIVPIGLHSTSLSKYIASAIGAIRDSKGIKYHEVTSMGTLVEAEDIDALFRAVKAARDAILEYGVKRIEILVRIDERLDKEKSLREKVESVQKYI
ncbi:MAG: MTH1187 family thiamine-binding protein [Candidatus Nitrosocaldus sp.]